MKRNNGVFFILLFFVFLFFGVEVGRGQNSTTRVNVGIVTDVGTKFSNMSLLCVNMSLSDFYSSRPALRTRLVVNVGDSKNNVVGAAAAALDLIENKEVKAILGPWTSMQAHFMIEIGQKSQVPIVSFSATSPILSSIRSPYFFRATYDDSSQVEAISDVIKLFGWREVVPVYVDNTFGEGIMPRLTDALQGKNVRIPYRTVIRLNATDDEISRELLRMMTLPTRVFIVHTALPLAKRIFAKAKENGLMKQGYVWILTNALTDVLSLMNSTDIEAMQGVLGVKTHIPRSKELDNYRARWRKRSPDTELNVYGLWAYDATTALAMAVEEVGIANLTFTKVDDGRNVSELAALDVSQYGPKLLTTLSDVRFKGLAGDFKFVNGQLKPLVFEIVNVIGEGGRSIGFWTEENGLVKRLNQKPRSTSTFSTWKDHLKTIIWPGDTTSVPKGWEIPTNGKKLRIGVPKRKGYTELVKVSRDRTTNAPVVTGFCIDFFEAIIQVMPYDVSYDFIPFENPDGEPAGTYNDLVQEVYLGKYDGVVGDTTILANRSSYVDFTLPFTKSGVAMVVPMKDVAGISSTTFLMPLTRDLWLTSFLFFFLIGSAVWVLEHKVNPEFCGHAKYQFSTIFWFAFSTMVFAPRESVRSFWARLLVITWYFIVLILTQSYTASLASLLTTQQLHPTVTSMKSLIEKGESVGYQRTSFVFGKLREAGFPASSLVPLETAEEYDDLLGKGPTKDGIAAAFMGVPYMRLFLGQFCNKYTMVEEPFKVDGFGFVFPIGSPLVSDVSRAILKVEESSKATELENAWFKKKDESCPDPITSPDPNPLVSFRKLGLDSFWVLFVVAAVVCVLALGRFAFFFLKENRDTLYQRNFRDLLQKFLQPDEDAHINHREPNPTHNARQN